MFVYPFNKYGFRANSSLSTMLGAESRALSKTELTTPPGIMELSLVTDDWHNDKRSVKNWKEGTQVDKSISQRKLGLPGWGKGGWRKGIWGTKKAIGDWKPGFMLYSFCRILLRTASVQYQKCKRCAACSRMIIPWESSTWANEDPHLLLIRGKGRVVGSMQS